LLGKKEVQASLAVAFHVIMAFVGERVFGFGNHNELAASSVGNSCRSRLYQCQSGRWSCFWTRLPAVVKAIPSSAYHEVRRDLSNWLREFCTDSNILKTHKDGRCNLYNKSTLAETLMESRQQCEGLKLGNVFGDKLLNEAQTPKLNITAKDFKTIVKCENKKDKRYSSKDVKFDMLVVMRLRL
jgi:hypothetical protein